VGVGTLPAIGIDELFRHGSYSRAVHRPDAADA